MHGIDSTRFWTLAKEPDMIGGINAMLHHNSVFHGLLKPVRWDAFDRLVEAHAADTRRDG